ncbi:ATP phosphoribosyltransferase regulatory subunit [Pantoea sp. BAV 3049]|uniref:ATP phosphoribosyltransferase regulatory subunit n=1 Tax=Pantoea sp. BAV 3049 TaxID=2654188 RepID=UPI001E60B4BB|nr:ATP phosphoribosyltransferase regulatory subunit [Pantoea sp. BAV 3049]
MTRKSRLFIQGMPHLVQLRGHNGELLFRDEADYLSFSHCLTLAALRYEIALHSWSLAPARILFFLSAVDKLSLGRFIQHIGRSYVPFYNRRYHRSGALWDNRYLSSPVEPGVYFLAVKRFIEQGEDGVRGYHSEGELPVGQVAPHAAWLQLGENLAQRQSKYQAFCQTPVNAALVARIRSALDQNCLLASPRVSEQLESQLERTLRPRHGGRPRKYASSPSEQWLWLEKQAGEFFQQRGYQQIRLSLLEREPLFSPGGPVIHGDGELRGDGTTGCLRLIATHWHEAAMGRLWYSGAMFCQSRHSERLQQNHQIGVEAFGMPGIDIELEHLTMQAQFLRRLGLADRVELYINTLGSVETLNCFRQALREYYQPVAHFLAREQWEWLETRPERLIHHDDILLQRLATRAPRLEEFLSIDACQRFSRMQHTLSEAGIAWQYDPALFPHNDYCQLVFEWRSLEQGENRVLCRGGRYDACASRVVGRAVSACGFAFMLEPLMALLSHNASRRKSAGQVDVVIIPCQPRGAGQALLLGRQLRQQFPLLSIMNDCSSQRLATRYKNSWRQGARFILELEGDGETLLLHDAQNQSCQQASVDTIAARLGNALML